jgi:hypothetical protein
VRKRPPFAAGLALAVLASASTWFYVNKILVAQQVADAAAQDRPRGNLSDLYPRWLGARELLRRGRNPYSPEITREIQQSYYGRPLDLARPGDPKDQQAFAYPVYIVFLLAPTIDLPFDAVQIGFRWLLVGLAVASVLLWLRVLRWSPPLGAKLIFIVLLLGWLPMVQGIKLQQLSLLVAALLAACVACLASGWLFCAGVLLALATIKPQLTWPLVLWLLLWASANDWRSRRRFVFGFGLVMLLLLGGAELVLPGWWRMFIAAIEQYHRYTQNQSVLTVMFGTVAGRILGVLSVVACAISARSLRAKSSSTEAFGQATSLVMSLTILIIPMSALYNQVLLAPTILALCRSENSGRPVLPAIRFARVACAILLVWPWIATVGLSLAYFWLTPPVRQRLWLMPFYSSLMLPVFVFGLALLDTWMTQTGMTQAEMTQAQMTQAQMTQARPLRESAPAE